MQTHTIQKEHARFRIVLRAMSRPGTCLQLPHISDQDDVLTLLVNMLSCLMDNEVTFHVINEDGSSCSKGLAGHTGSRIVPLKEADFVIAPNGSSNGQLNDIRRGSLEYPNDGATIVYLVDEICSGNGPLTLSGPGIAGSMQISFTGLDHLELLHLRDVNAQFPLGVDAIFLDRSGRVACIPRSTRIGEQ